MAKPEPTRHHKFYILNIKLRDKKKSNDLETEDYIKLFETVFKKKIHKESSNSKHCIFRTSIPVKDSENILYFKGTFVQFTFIENNRWIDLETMEIDEAFRIKDGLFPDPKFFDFVFIPAAHRFCYRVSSGNTASPYAIKNFLKMALDTVSKENYVDVDVETDRSTIEKIVESKHLRKLIIDINYTNHDFSSAAAKQVEKEMRDSKTSKMRIEATAKPDGGGIDIYKSTYLEGGLALSTSNGEATAKIVNSKGRTETIKTEDFPFMDSVFSTLSRFSDSAYDYIMKKFRPKNKNGKSAN